MLQGGRVCHLSRLLLQVRDPLSQTRDPRLELAFLDQPVRVTIDQPRHALLQFPHLRFSRRTLVHRCRSCLQPAAILVRELLRLLKQPAHLLPHGGVEQIGPHLGIRAHPLPAEAIGIGADTAIVRIRAGVSLRRTHTDRLTIVGVAALCTGHQPLQEVARATLPLAGAPPIFLQLLLHGGEQRRTDQGGHGDRDPFLRRHILR